MKIHPFSSKSCIVSALHIKVFGSYSVNFTYRLRQGPDLILLHLDSQLSWCISCKDQLSALNGLSSRVRNQLMPSEGLFWGSQFSAPASK